MANNFIYGPIGNGSGSSPGYVLIKNIKFVSSIPWDLAAPDFTSNMKTYLAAVIYNPTNDINYTVTQEQKNTISNLTFKKDTPYLLNKKVKLGSIVNYYLYGSFKLISTYPVSNIHDLATRFLDLFGSSPTLPPGVTINPLKGIQINGTVPAWLRTLKEAIDTTYPPTSVYSDDDTQAIPCLLTGTKVNTPRGFVNIEDIVVGDTVYNHEMEPVPIVKTHKWDISWGSKHFGETVYKIAKNTYGATDDIYISAHHKILINDYEMVEAFQLGLPKALKGEIARNDIYTLCHIQMENHYINNFIINGNCIVESWDGVLTIKDRATEQLMFKNFMDLTLKEVFGTV